MSKTAKILLSIPSVIGIAYMISFWYVDFLFWVTDKLVEIKYLVPLINGILLIQIACLLYRLWSFKNLPRKLRVSWTAILVIFNILAGLVYIWIKDREFERLNKSNV